jgi:hypothetical protein
MMRSMTYDEFLRHIDRADLKLQEFAALIKMNPNSVSNYAKTGEVPSHLAVIAVLLGEMESLGIDYRALLAKIDIAPKKPRGAGIGKFGGTN